MEHYGLSYHKESRDVIKRISDQQFLLKICATPVHNALVRTSCLSTSQCRGTRHSKDAALQKYKEVDALRQPPRPPAKKPSEGPVPQGKHTALFIPSFKETPGPFWLNQKGWRGILIIPLEGSKDCATLW